MMVVRCCDTHAFSAQQLRAAAAAAAGHRALRARTRAHAHPWTRAPHTTHAVTPHHTRALTLQAVYGKSEDDLEGPEARELKRLMKGAVRAGCDQDV